MNVTRYRKTKTASVLYIDDDEPSSIIDKNNFKQYGLETTIVLEASQAAEKYLEVRPDIVIIDLEFQNQPKNGVDVLTDLFRVDKDLGQKIVFPNSIHMSSNDDLGMKFWNAYQKLLGKEPITIVNKLKENRINDLVFVIGHLIQDAVGELDMHPELREYIERRDNEY